MYLVLLLVLSRRTCSSTHISDVPLALWSVGLRGLFLRRLREHVALATRHLGAQFDGSHHVRVVVFNHQLLGIEQILLNALYILHCRLEQQLLQNDRQLSFVFIRKCFHKAGTGRKRRIKQLDWPHLQIQQQASDRGRAHTRALSSSSSDRRSWRAGRDVSSAFYCFLSLLFQSPDTEALWTTTGVRDLKQLSEKCKRHENSRSHLDSAMKPGLLGKLGISS
ncbi:hypothetical protein MHYP_G00311100 [Metynnis hypsauchen]